MPTAKITKRSVDGSSAGFLWDDELKGFGLKTSSSGRRTYVFQYRMGGRETLARRYTIGSHGSPWTPNTAREEAKRLSLAVKQGIDPKEAKRRRRRETVELAIPAYVQRFLERYVRTEWRASYDFAETILRLHVTPHIRHKSLPEITKVDISDLLDRIPSHQTALRRNVYAVVRRLLRWAVGRGDLDRNPLEGFEPPAGPNSRDRVLSDTELSVVWATAQSIQYPFGPLFQLLIATGQRREEVAGLRWEELDRKASVWTLPARRSKNARSHIVPLSSVAIGILDRCARGSRWPRSGFVFSTTGKSPVSGHSRAKAGLDKRIADVREAAGLPPFEPWRVHDLRRTMATGFQRLGTRFEVTEAVLNHVSGSRGGVAGIYQRHDWASEKRIALDSWGKHLEGLHSEQDAANVIQMHRVSRIGVNAEIQR